jgi:hypothetical protein
MLLLVIKSVRLVVYKSWPACEKGLKSGRQTTHDNPQ